jgi:hypothetical protein
MLKPGTKKEMVKAEMKETAFVSRDKQEKVEQEIIELEVWSW